MNTPERVAAWYKKDTYPETHFSLNEQTGDITFHPETPQYKAEKIAFLAHGVDIDSIHDINTYDQYCYTFRNTLHAVIKARALNRKSNSLDAQFLKAYYLRDKDECDRLSTLLGKRHRLNLHQV